MGDLLPSNRMAGTTSQLFTSLYAALRALAAERLRGERANHSLGATALVHEMYLRLSGSLPGSWQSEQDFLAAAAVTARRVLVDFARQRRAAKRGGQRPLPLNDTDHVADDHCWAEVVEIDDALSRLGELDERRGRVAMLRVFGGLGNEEIAAVLSVSRATVATDWFAARGWLSQQIRGRRA